MKIPRCRSCNIHGYAIDRNEESLDVGVDIHGTVEGPEIRQNLAIYLALESVRQVRLTSNTMWSS